MGPAGSRKRYFRDRAKAWSWGESGRLSSKKRKGRKGGSAFLTSSRKEKKDGRGYLFLETSSKKKGGFRKEEGIAPQREKKKLLPEFEKGKLIRPTPAKKGH